jgi:predicted Zn-dependent peptidase
VSVSGIDRNLEQSVDLLDKWLRTAAFEQDRLDKLVENRISLRADNVKKPRFVSSALGAFARRGKDSVYLLAPSNKMLAKAKTKQLAKLLAKLPDYQHKTAYFGPRPAADAAKVVALGKKHRKLAPRKPVTYRKVRGVRIYFTHKDVAQAQIGVLIPKKPIPVADRPIAELYNRYVGGGFGGLIFQEIREARGLAYSARASHFAGSRPRDESGVSGSIGTQNDKTIEALQTMLDLLRNTPMQPDRLDKAQQAIDQRYRASRVSPRSINGWVRSWDELGLDSDPRPTYWAKHKTLDAKALEQFAKRFAKSGVIISIMADRAHVDLDALKKLGKVELVKPEKLFSY